MRPQDDDSTRVELARMHLGFGNNGHMAVSQKRPSPYDEATRISVPLLMAPPSINPPLRASGRP